MKFKGILLDIDNTLYDYNSCHERGMESVQNFISTNIPTQINFMEAFGRARKFVHYELLGTAASHNRLLYFQKTCELLNINPMDWALDMYESYWGEFLDNMVLFEGVKEFLSVAKNDMKICFVTDLTAHIQYRKIKKLGLNDYVSAIVTSEEAGHEKPHPYIFMSALSKMNLSADCVCMIGDNYKKDILGAYNIGMKSYYKTDTDHCDFDDKENRIIQFDDFKQLKGLIYE